MIVRRWSVLAVAAVVTLSGQAYAHSAPRKAPKAHEVAKKIAVERSPQARANAPGAAVHNNAQQKPSRADKPHKKAKAAAKRAHRAKADQRRADRPLDRAGRRAELKQDHPRLKRAVREFRRNDNTSDRLKDRLRTGAREQHRAGRDRQGQRIEREYSELRERYEAPERYEEAERYEAPEGYEAESRQANTRFDRNRRAFSRVDRAARDGAKNRPNAARRSNQKLRRADRQVAKSMQKARPAQRIDRSPRAARPAAKQQQRPNRPNARKAAGNRKRAPGKRG